MEWNVLFVEKIRKGFIMDNLSLDLLSLLDDFRSVVF